MARRSFTKGRRGRGERQRTMKGHSNDILVRKVGPPWSFPGHWGVFLVEFSAGSRPVVVREGGDRVQSPHQWPRLFHRQSTSSASEEEGGMGVGWFFCVFFSPVGWKDAREGAEEMRVWNAGTIIARDSDGRMSLGAVYVVSGRSKEGMKMTMINEGKGKMIPPSGQNVNGIEMYTEQQLKNDGQPLHKQTASRTKNFNPRPDEPWHSILC